MYNGCYKLFNIFYRVSIGLRVKYFTYYNRCILVDDKQ